MLFLVRNWKYGPFGISSYKWATVNYGQFVLTPKKQNYVAYNSYLPQVTVSLAENEITLQYTLLRSIRWWSACSLLLALVIESVLLVKLAKSVNNIFPLLLLPIVCVLGFLMTAVGFGASQRVVEKALLSAWEMS